MTAAQAKDVGDMLIQLLTQQALLYRQLHELAQKQGSLVDGRNPEMLLRVLAGRQRIIDRLSVIDGQLRPIRAQWQEVTASLPAAQREEAQSLVTQVQSLLGEILAQDEKDTQALSSQHQEVAQELRGAAQGRRMNKAYGMASSPMPQSRLDLSE